MQELEVKPLRWYSEEPVFYVYVHKRPDGSIFYVGKGRDDRAWVKKSRNRHWSNVVNKYGGFDVEIIESGLTEPEAFAKEHNLIVELGIENLTNQTLGGISTTGYRHSEETKRIQGEITKRRIEENPEYAKKLLDSLSELHYKQRHDLEYKQLMSNIQKESYNNLSEEEKEKRNAKKRERMKDPEVRAKISRAVRKSMTEERRKSFSEIAKARWASLSEEEALLAKKRSMDVLNRPENREKAIESASDKIVVNKRHVFSSKIQFLTMVNSSHAPLSKSLSVGKEKYGFDFCVFKGYFVEEYCEEKHKDVPVWDGNEISKLNFDCLPRSKAVVMDESVVFLSMTEASVFCNGKTVEATADFITKNMKIGKPAMGYYWRIATNSEIENEIYRRVALLI